MLRWALYSTTSGVSVGAIVQYEAEKVKISLMIVLRDASELRQLLAKEAMAVLTAVDVGVAEHVRIVVRDRQMSVNTVVLVDIIIDRAYSSAEILTDSGRIDFLHC